MQQGLVLTIASTLLLLFGGETARGAATTLLPVLYEQSTCVRVVPDVHVYESRAPCQN